MAFGPILQQNAHIKSEKCSWNLLLHYSVIFPYLTVFNNRRWTVNAPQCCSAVIIGREESIFYLARQSCDSCVGGQHEQRSCVCVYRVYLCMDRLSNAETNVCIITMAHTRYSYCFKCVIFVAFYVIKGWSFCWSSPLPSFLPCCFFWWKLSTCLCGQKHLFCVLLCVGVSLKDKGVQELKKIHSWV